MSRTFHALFLLLWISLPGWAQDEPAGPAEPDAAETSDEGAETGEASEEPKDAAPEEGEAEGEGEGGPAVGIDEIPELDEQTHEQDDEEFIPTEEIPVDQSIPFPTDI